VLNLPVRLLALCLAAGAGGAAQPGGLALEVDGPSHHAANGGPLRPLGPTLSRDWLLRRLGWRAGALAAWPRGASERRGALLATVSDALMRGGGGRGGEGRSGGRGSGGASGGRGGGSEANGNV
jgi:hypothetical protein